MKRKLESIVIGVVVGLILKALDKYGGINILKSIFQTFIIELWPIWGGLLAACIYWLIKDYLKLRHPIQYSKDGGNAKEIDLLRKEINDLKKWIGSFSYKDKYSNLKGKIKLYISEELKKRDLEKKDEPITIRRIGDQTFQSLTGGKLIEKWEIKSLVLLNIVKKQLINAYTPDERQNIIANATEQDIEKSLGFHSENNETDEDAVLHFIFKPTDIREFEGKIAKGEIPGFVLKK